MHNWKSGSIIFLIYIFFANNSYAQDALNPQVNTNDTLAISLIKYLWEEDNCANKQFRQYIGFFILKNNAAFLGKTQSEIKDIFGEPQNIGGKYDQKNKKVEGVVSYNYIAEGELCKSVNQVSDFDISFYFIENKLVEIDGSYR